MYIVLPSTLPLTLYDKVGLTVATGMVTTTEPRASKGGVSLRMRFCAPVTSHMLVSMMS